VFVRGFDGFETPVEVRVFLELEELEMSVKKRVMSEASGDTMIRVTIKANEWIRRNRASTKRDRKQKENQTRQVPRTKSIEKAMNEPARWSEYR
jgi:hypothetical protein